MSDNLQAVSELSLSDGAQSFIKIAEVSVEFAEADGVLRTLEGEVPYHAGDALLTGVQGECWPVEWNKFDGWYRPVEGKAGRFYKIKSVLAKQMPYTFRVPLADGQTFLTGKAGDWVVQTAVGSLGVVDEKIFPQIYRSSR